MLKNLHTHTHTQKVKNTQTSNWVCLTVQSTELLLHEGNGQCRCTWYMLTCLIKTQALKQWCCTFTLIVGYWKAFHTLVVVFWHRCKLHENLQFIMADLKLHKIYCSVWSERKPEGKVGWCIYLWLSQSQIRIRKHILKKLTFASKERNKLNDKN